MATSAVSNKLDVAKNSSEICAGSTVSVEPSDAHGGAVVEQREEHDNLCGDAADQKDLDGREDSGTLAG